MNRILLAFLALIGIAAQPATAGTRDCGSGQTAVEACLSGAVQLARCEVRAERFAARQPRHGFTGQPATASEPDVQVAHVATVMIGSDRARI